MKMIKVKIINKLIIKIKIVENIFNNNPITKRYKKSESKKLFRLVTVLRMKDNYKFKFNHKIKKIMNSSNYKIL